MLEDLGDDEWILDEGDQLASPPARVADEGVLLEHSIEEFRPRVVARVLESWARDFRRATRRGPGGLVTALSRAGGRWDQPRAWKSESRREHLRALPGGCCFELAQVLRRSGEEELAEEALQRERMLREER